ncbi:MAG: endonuclease/exonuclease/phosphatase family protein [Candidatus Rokuibacteriota bacterium]
MRLAVLLLALWAGTAFAEPARPLRIVTYNILHGGPASGFSDGGTHLPQRLAMAIRALTALDPDIVALQEASRSRRYGNVPEAVAEALGLHLVFAPATDRVFGFRPLGRLLTALLGFTEGSAVLSRFPIVDSEVYDLPRCRRFLDPRILLRAEVATPWGPLQIYSTHTSRNADCQGRRVGEIVRERRDAGPSLLMGDFNMSESSAVLTALREEAAFVDVFRAANPDHAGHTVWQRLEAERSTVFRRVDYIFLLDGQRTAGAVRSSRVVLDRPGQAPDGGPLWPSDHYGVYAEVEIVPTDQPRALAR